VTTALIGKEVKHDKEKGTAGSDTRIAFGHPGIGGADAALGSVSLHHTPKRAGPQPHLDIWNVFIPKIAVHDVVYRSDNGKCDWVVYLRGYMYFYLPGGKMRVIMSCDGTHSLSGGLRSSWEDFEPLPPVE
jgi:hypothetical protein